MSEDTSTKDDRQRVVKVVKEIAKEVTTATDSRMLLFKKEANAYAAKKTRENNPILDKLIRIIK